MVVSWQFFALSNILQWIATIFNGKVVHFFTDYGILVKKKIRKTSKKRGEVSREDHSLPPLS